ncbi:tRNA (guanosine(18)-2'-O)-methyltransferase TrmH [Gallaecimonas sp. GXIMD4217]|uniref:tRNA (guanosine(18)-2'-O)-methyltransferase TrmH n=1 Tax=Gallaecimonas sp. GXIMD4217 TaxID=3131927 RepID=UPI00311AC442
MTPERFHRINQVLSARQPDLTLCMEEVHKSHNLSAIIRTADAVGIHEIHAIHPPGQRLKIGAGRAAGSQNWVKVTKRADIQDAVSHFKAQGMQVVATHLSDKAVDFRQIDYTQPTAIILGQEKTGISDEALALADHHVIIPMLGMVQSLNVSVANALILYEAQRQRQQAGLYDRCRLPRAEFQRILFERGHPIFARVCKHKGMPYPEIDDQGQIVADDHWWAQMQMTRSAWEHMDDEES